MISHNILLLRSSEKYERSFPSFHIGHKNTTLSQDNPREVKKSKIVTYLSEILCQCFLQLWLPGRGSDLEIDAQGKRPDVRKDDMSARRNASSDSRSSVPFNQFLPNRTNASSYIPAPRRRPHTDEGEQRR